MFKVYLNLAIFLIIAIAGYGLLHYSVYKNIVNGFNLTGNARLIFKIIIILGAFSFPVGEILSRKLCPGSHSIVYIGALWIGLISIAFFVLFLNYILTIIFNNANFKYYSTLISVILICFAFLYSFYNVKRPVRIKEIILPCEKLPDSIGEFTIVQLSDIHLGAVTSKEWLNGIVEKTNNLNPDLIVITGDIIDADISSCDDVISALMNLRSKYGVYAVTGNHEFYAGINVFMSIMKKTGIIPLRNKCAVIANAINLAGVDDKTAKQFEEGKSDLEKALKGCDVSKPVVLLNHQPLEFKKAVEKGVFLQLSGHTHAGQIPPLDLLVLLVYKYPFGLHKYKDSYIYTTFGTGTWGPPLRLFSYSEIVKITMKK